MRSFLKPFFKPFIKRKSDIEFSFDSMKTIVFMNSYSFEQIVDLNISWIEFVCLQPFKTLELEIFG